MGKAYKNLMVDVRATNVKLKDRSVRIMMNAVDVERAEAEALLQAADGNIKTAIVMYETNVTRQQAEELLEKNEGYVRRTIRCAGGK